MILQILFVILGFACLIFGANWLVDGASDLARKYHVSELVIGLTIVAFGTSAPELVVSMVGSFNGFSDIVVGNVLGSNIFNLFIILGITGLIFPISIKSSTAWKEIPISLIATILLFVFINDFHLARNGILTRIDSFVLFIMFFLFLFYVYRQMKNDSLIESEHTVKSPIKIWTLILIGLASLIIGGQFVVINSVKIANHLGISEKIIALTIVASGTSLPELITSIVAISKKNSDIAIGNVIGSNIFNILLILSISSMIMPIQYNPKFNIDFYVLIVGTVFLLTFMLTGKRKKLDRWEAVVLLGCYLIYFVYLISQEI